MRDESLEREPGDRVAGQATTSQTGLIFAAVVAIALFPTIFGVYGWLVAGQGDRPLVTERTEWPGPLLESFTRSALTDRDLESIELTPVGDGWYLRMKATPTAVEYVTTTLAPADKVKSGEPASESFAGATKEFWENMPHRWRNHKPSASDRFYATPDRDWLARLNDEDKMVLIWSGLKSQ